MLIHTVRNLSISLGEIEQIAASQGRGVTQLMEQVLAPLAEKLQENEAENDRTSDEEEKDEWDHEFDFDSEEDTSDDLEVDAGILALHEENPDCIGWLTIDGTRIDYPVMYRPGDKNYYLHRDFNGEYSANGCLFLAEECVPGNSDNLIIYGHHMNSGKMFD